LMVHAHLPGSSSAKETEGQGNTRSSLRQSFCAAAQLAVQCCA
jgi:hypothetical protein